VEKPTWKKRLAKKMNKKLVALFNLILVLTAISGLAYAHWSDTLIITGTVTMAKINAVIESYKAITPVGYDEIAPISTVLSPDASTLEISCDNVFPCWLVWVGLNTHNVGTVPVSVKDVAVSYEDSNNIAQYFKVEEYFYGPYNDGDFKAVWGDVRVDGLPFDGSSPLPIAMEPCRHVIAWIKIHFDTDNTEVMNKSIKIFITIVDDLAI